MSEHLKRFLTKLDFTIIHWFINKCLWQTLLSWCTLSLLWRPVYGKQSLSKEFWYVTVLGSRELKVGSRELKVVHYFSTQICLQFSQ